MEISENDYMGKGIAKVVYKHPSDPNICIKFPNGKKRRALRDILREISYLKKHQQNLPWLSAYLGEIHCDRGIGYMYEIVRNEDGSPSQSISEFDHEKHTEILKQKIAAMYLELIKEHAVVNDLSLNNIFVSMKTKGDFDLILIDGFGNNNFIKIADYSKYFLREKLNRKFGKLCGKLKISSDFLL